MGYYIPWQDKDVTFLRSNYTTMTNIELSIAVRRTESAVKNMLYVLGIKRPVELALKQRARFRHLTRANVLEDERGKMKIAKWKVKYAVKCGHITKGRCTICGKARVEAHHEDYDMPLSVVWLCNYHHKLLHSPGGANIRELLKKAGKSWEDKPKI